MQIVKIEQCFCKGDNINFEGLIKQDITDWKIRAELYDASGHSQQLATTNSGGSNAQIDVTSVSPTKSFFLIHILKGITTDFDNVVFLEIEVETDDGEIFTPMKAEIMLSDQKIKWETPS